MVKLIFAICSLFCGIGLFGQSISEWRGSGRDGVYNYEKNLLKEWPKNGPELLWYTLSIPKGYGSVAVANNLVYITGVLDTMDVLVALDNSGKEIWRKPYGRKWDNSFDESRCTPTVENNKIYVSSGLGDVACIEAEAGEILWQIKANEKFNGSAGRYGVAESLLIVDDKVIYTPGGDSTTMVALNKFTGEPIWKTKSIHDDASYTSPMLIKKNGKSIICTITNNYFIGVDAENGNILWQFNYGTYADAKGQRRNQANTPLYYNGCFFLTSGYDHKSVMLKLADDAGSVSVKWVDSVLDIHHGGAVQLNGYIYGANWLHNKMGNWVCLDWETGRVMYSTEWFSKGSIISADGMLYCYEEKLGNFALVLANTNKFEVVSSFKVTYGDGPHWAHPVINGGKLYIRHENAIMVYNITQ